MIKNKKPLNSSGMNFFIIKEKIYSKLEIKNSVFITNIKKINSKIEALDLIMSIKKKHNGAAHHCWGYIIGNPLNPQSIGSNDGGEPHRSAGKPIIDVLRHKNIGYIVVVVTRYFGGIKLGIGKLRRAYYNSTSIALNNTKLEYFFEKQIVKFMVSYDFKDFFLDIVKRLNISIINIKYLDLVIFKLSINENIYDEFIQVIKNRSRNKVVFKVV